MLYWSWLDLALELYNQGPIACTNRRTIVDYHQWNENTVKDITPFLDQDNIHLDVACRKYWSKLDMSDAFINIDGTFVSNVMV